MVNASVLTLNDLIRTNVGGGMEISVLGPLRIKEDATQAAPTAKKPRKVLALLLLNESRVVSISSLLTELWDSAPPKSALTTMQTYVLQLRKMLARATGRSLAEVAAELLHTSTSGGYVFTAPEASFDLRRYQELEQLGGRALADGDLDTASRTFRRAL